MHSRSYIVREMLQKYEFCFDKYHVSITRAVPQVGWHQAFPHQVASVRHLPHLLLPGSTDLDSGALQFVKLIAPIWLLTHHLVKEGNALNKI